MLNLKRDKLRYRMKLYEIGANADESSASESSSQP
jgi:hypothetical protein